MRYKKIIFWVLIIVLNYIGMLNVYADNIYRHDYTDEDESIRITLSYNEATKKLTAYNAVTTNEYEIYNPNIITDGKKISEYTLVYDINNKLGQGEKIYIIPKNSASSETSIKEYIKKICSSCKEYNEKEQVVFNKGFDDENYEDKIEIESPLPEKKESKICYYIDEMGMGGFKIILNEDKPKASKVIVNRFGLTFPDKKLKVSNWKKGAFFLDSTTNPLINEYSGDECPSRLTVVKTFKIPSYYAYANLNQQEANEKCKSIDKVLLNYCHMYTATLRPNMTEEEYNNEIMGSSTNPEIEVGKDDPAACEDIFGNVNQAGYIIYEMDGNKPAEDQYGNKIIKKEVPPSLAYMIHQALSIARIIAIVLVITLGITDFAKAVIAGNEDEMKKNQKRFIKRLIICVAIFLVPVIVDLIMKLIDTVVTTGTRCEYMLK